jgi:hypothetical protein
VSLEVQAHLLELRTLSVQGTVEANDKGAHGVETKRRGAMRRLSVKEVSSSLQKIARSSVESVTEQPTLFAYRAVQAVVEKMLAAVGEALIEDREPEARLKAIVNKFVSHPDIASVIRLTAMNRLGLDEKQLAVVEHVLDQLREAIEVHKGQKSKESMRLYQIILNFISPPASARLQRATATLFGLDSRRGLRAAAVRLAAQRIDIEAGINPPTLFYAPDRATRSDWLAGAPMRAAAVAHWTLNTRPTSCVKNVVTLDDETKHPVHWLEDTIVNFYKSFLDSCPPSCACRASSFPISLRRNDDHYYRTQLLLRHVPEGTAAGSVRIAFRQWRVSRVNPMHEGTYFYIVFQSEGDCTAALRAAQAPGFSLTTTATRRPLMGITAFTNERPPFVKDVTEVSCACHRCQGFAHLFRGLMSFKHWDEVCPSMSELVADIKHRAAPFTPSVHTLLEVLLCPADPATTFLHKKCCYGKCSDCGWPVRLLDLDVEDEIQEEVDDTKMELDEAKRKPVFVTFKTYENISEQDDDIVVAKKDEDFEAVSQKCSRPTLLKQTLAPSSFLRIFAPALTAYQKHRFERFLMCALGKRN